MKLALLGLLAAALALPSVTLKLPAAALETRTPISASNVQLQGPSVVLVRDLPPATLSGAAEQTPPRLRVPRIAASGEPVANAIDTGAGIAAAPVTASGFEGLSNSDNLAIAGLDLTPPDPQIAVGPDDVVEFINNVGRVSDRGGNAIATFSLSDFFAVQAGHAAFDPKLIYDALSGRWFATMASRLNSDSGPDQGGLYLAVSTTSDPTGEWKIYTRSFTNIFPDQPGLGLTDDKVTVSSNMGGISAVDQGKAGGECFKNGGFCGEQTVVYQKSDLLAGLPADQVGAFAFPMLLDRFTVRPAHSLTSISDQYLATFSTASPSKADIIRITGTPAEGNVTEAAVTELIILTQQDPPPSITSGSGSCIIFVDSHGPPPCIDSGDFRLLETVWRDNKMWLAASGACRPSGDSAARSCAHLIEVNTEGTPAKTQDMMYGAPGEYYSWPAIRTNAEGDLIVSVTHTSASILAEARVAGRLAGDAPNTMGGSTLVKAGEAVHTSGRWGDYLGAAVDPAHPSCVWIVGEYAKTTQGRDWSTYVASAGYGDGCPAPPVPTVTPAGTIAGSPTPSATPSVTPTFTPTPTLTPTLTPTVTPTPTLARRSGDVNCDDAVSSLDAALVLQYSAHLVASLRCQQTADVNDDGTINALDAVLILQLNAGLLSTLPR